VEKFAEKLSKIYICAVAMYSLSCHARMYFT